MSQPKVSIVIPCYNVETYLRECIDSALAQTLQEIEVICVNDGSTDGTLSILKEYEASDARLRIIDKPNSGYGDSMNRGFDAANGEYVAILEADDYLKPNMFEVLYEQARKHDLDVIKSDFEIFVGDGSERVFTYMNTCRKRNQYYRIINPEQNVDIFNARMNTWTGLYRKEFLDRHHIRHNTTPGASYQDNGFWFQTFMWAERVMFVDRAFYQLRRDNPNSSVHNRGKVFCIFEEYAFIEKLLRADPHKCEKLIQIFQKKKFDNCLYHFRRVGAEFRSEFLRRMSDEFKQARAAGELDKNLFFGSGWSNLYDIMDSPEVFHAHSCEEEKEALTPEQQVLILKRQLHSAQAELEKIRRSRAYRIGRCITWPVRKLRGGIRCVKENGWHYTVSHIGRRIKERVNIR